VQHGPILIILGLQHQEETTQMTFLLATSL